VKLKVLITIGVLLVLLACGGKREQGTSPAPYFSLRDVNGRTVTLEDFKGEPFVLVFWATWCPTCLKEIPLLNKLTQEGHRVVAVTLNRDREQVKRFIEEHRIVYPILMGTYQVTIDYGNIRFLPTIFFVNAKGYIVEKSVGMFPEEKAQEFFKGN